MGRVRPFCHVPRYGKAKSIITSVRHIILISQKIFTHNPLTGGTCRWNNCIVFLKNFLPAGEHLQVRVEPRTLQQVYNVLSSNIWIQNVCVRIDKTDRNIRLRIRKLRLRLLHGDKVLLFGFG